MDSSGRAFLGSKPKSRTVKVLTAMKNIPSSGKLSRTVNYTSGDTEQFKVRPYKKVNGVTYYGAWSNVVTIKAGLPV